jgi:hypothetical protein
MNSNELKTAGCFRQENWRFPLTGMHWLGIGGLCVEASESIAGAGLTLQVCSNSNRQRWELFSLDAGQIRLANTQLCVAAIPENLQNPDGTTLKLLTCDANDVNQNFDLSEHSHIRYDVNVCVQVKASNLDGGAPLVLGSPCSERALEQMFHLSGTISHDETYVSVKEDFSFVNARLVGRARDRRVNAMDVFPEWQQWDYYW